eukprot:9646502-Alexandrium_andersonii.AAC.1
MSRRRRAAAFRTWCRATPGAMLGLVVCANAPCAAGDGLRRALRGIFTRPPQLALLAILRA